MKMNQYVAYYTQVTGCKADDAGETGRMKCFTTLKCLIDGGLE